MPFIDQLQHWALTDPHRAAVVVGREQLSFSQLFEAARSSAPSCRIPSQPEPRERAGVALTIIDEPNGTKLAVRFAGAVAGHGVAAVLDSSWPQLLKADIAERAVGWADAQPDVASASDGFRDGPPGSTFLLGLSSGTSGVPKAFTRSRQSWRVSFEASARYFGLKPADVTLAPGPMAASMNLYALGEALFTGSTFVSLEHFSADTALRAIVDHAATRLVLVPTVLALLAERGLDTGQGAGSLTSIVCAGSTVPADVLELARRWAPHARIFHYYGASELGFVAAAEAAAGTETGSQAVLCAGKAFPGAQFSVRASDGQPAGTGECGSIYVRSPFVSNGYAWGDDGLAFNVLADSDGDGTDWHTVHDQGFQDSAGNLHVVGRASDMIVTGGANVYPQQVEAALEAVVGPGTVVVAGLADPIRGQRVVAGLFAEGARPGSPSLSTLQLLTACRRRAAALPAHQRPTLYYQLLQQPLTGNGKLSRALLAAWISEGDSRAQRIH